MKTKWNLSIRVVCLILATLMLAACEVDTSDDGGGYDDGSGGWNSGSGNYDSCPTTNETDIRGVENNQWPTMMMAADGDFARIRLQTVRDSSRFNRVQWNVGLNRQTCTMGPVVQSHGDSFLQIGIPNGPTGNFMEVAPGSNYIDYEAYGCTSFDCSTLIESGTFVLYVETE